MCLGEYIMLKNIFVFVVSVVVGAACMWATAHVGQGFINGLGFGTAGMFVAMIGSFVLGAAGASFFLGTALS